MTKRTKRIRRDSPIAESIIHTWVGEAQFNRGLKYVEQGLVRHMHRRGYDLTAVCLGRTEATQRYQIRATVAEGKIEAVVCSCSIGKHGVCPHIAAVLITYSRTPNQFKVVSLMNWLKGLLGLDK